MNKEDLDPIEKEEVKDDTRASLPPLTRIFASLISSVMSLAITYSIPIIIWLLLMAIIWGAGSHAIAAAFKWSWDLFGF